MEVTSRPAACKARIAAHGWIQDLLRILNIRPRSIALSSSPQPFEQRMEGLPGTTEAQATSGSPRQCARLYLSKLR